ncbi:hypothetical protein PR048_024739 [Dryococelus australis]|uniref:Uncharacterized protein n=1 Tax=Dryococelus australis TaxID=614101 RepID=A0ABQ9GPF0_9NEOP|nr:hypothetical protein PR048_024739 [Dryococelus australis]
MQGRGEREIPEKALRPAASSGTIPTCKNLVGDPARNRTRASVWPRRQVGQTLPSSVLTMSRAAQTPHFFVVADRSFYGVRGKEMKFCRLAALAFRSRPARLYYTLTTFATAPRPRRSYPAVLITDLTADASSQQTSVPEATLQNGAVSVVGYPPGDPPTSGIVRHGFPLAKIQSDPAGNRTRLVQRLKIAVPKFVIPKSRGGGRADFVLVLLRWISERSHVARQGAHAFLSPSRLCPSFARLWERALTGRTVNNHRRGESILPSVAAALWSSTPPARRPGGATAQTVIYPSQPAREAANGTANHPPALTLNRNARAGETGDPRESPQVNGNAGTIPSCENPGVTRPGIEPHSPWREASNLTAHPQQILTNTPRGPRWCSGQTNHLSPGRTGFDSLRERSRVFRVCGISPDDAAGWRIFTGISRSPRPCIPALLHAHLASPSSTLRTTMSPLPPTT